MTTGSILRRIWLVVKESGLDRATGDCFFSCPSLDSLEMIGRFSLLPRKVGCCSRRRQNVSSGRTLSNRSAPPWLKHCFSKAGTVDSGHITDAFQAILSLSQAGQGGKNQGKTEGHLKQEVAEASQRRLGTGHIYIAGAGHLTDASRATLSLSQAGQVGEKPGRLNKAGEPTLTAGASSPLLLHVSTAISGALTQD